jgi:hypothetical protein
MNQVIPYRTLESSPAYDRRRDEVNPRRGGADFDLIGLVSAY